MAFRTYKHGQAEFVSDEIIAAHVRLFLGDPDAGVTVIGDALTEERWIASSKGQSLSGGWFVDGPELDIFDGEQDHADG